MVRTAIVAFLFASTPSYGSVNEVERAYIKMFASSQALEADPFAALSDIKTPAANILDIPFSDGNAKYPSADTTAYYSIEGSKITFMFVPENVGRLSDKVWDIIAFRKSLPLGVVSGQNAFGVKRRIALQENHIGKLQVRVLPEGMDFPGHPSIPGLPQMPKDNYWHEFEIEGPSTKALLTDLVVRLEVVWLGDSLDPQNNCSTTTKDATVDHPTALKTYECTALAAISKVSFVNKRTGAVVSAWPPAN